MQFLHMKTRKKTMTKGSAANAGHPDGPAG
jgi:hypothetical protein